MLVNGNDNSSALVISETRAFSSADGLSLDGALLVVEASLLSLEGLVDSPDLSVDLSEDLSEDLSVDLSEDLSVDLSEDLSEDLSDDFVEVLLVEPEVLPVLLSIAPEIALSISPTVGLSFPSRALSMSLAILAFVPPSAWHCASNNSTSLSSVAIVRLCASTSAAS